MKRFILLLKIIVLWLISMLVGCLYCLFSVYCILPYQILMLIVICSVTQALLVIISKRLNIFNFKSKKINLICIALFAVSSFILFIISYTWTTAIIYGIIMRNFH